MGTNLCLNHLCSRVLTNWHLPVRVLIPDWYLWLWHCQVVGDDIVTRQQQALSGGDFYRPDA